MLLFSFSICSDWCSLKIENETRVPRVELINIETYSGWLELSLTGSNFHGPKPVRATEVLL